MTLTFSRARVSITCVKQSFRAYRLRSTPPRPLVDGQPGGRRRAWVASAVVAVSLASARAQFTYDVNDGKATITGYTGVVAHLVVPAAIDGYPVVSIGTSAFDSRADLLSVALPDSVTSVENSAFYNCVNLTTAVLGAAVADIGDYAFSKCGSLISITISKSTARLGNSAFEACSNLAAVTFGSALTNIGDRAFRQCAKLAAAPIATNVVAIGNYAFDGCVGLTAVAIPDSVTTVGDYAFSSCTNLQTAVIGNGVAQLGSHAFDDCAALQSVQLGGGLTNIGASAFSYCARMETVNIPPSVTTIGPFAFSFCSSLQRVTMGAGVAEIGMFAFGSCTNLAQALCEGDAPTTVGPAVFENSFPVVYRRYGATGWGATFADRPTAIWPETLTAAVFSGGVRLYIAASTGQTVRIEVCSDLVVNDWSLDATLEVGSSGILQYDVPAPPSGIARCYRVSLP